MAQNSLSSCHAVARKIACPAAKLAMLRLRIHVTESPAEHSS